MQLVNNVNQSIKNIPEPTIDLSKEKKRNGQAFPNPLKSNSAIAAEPLSKPEETFLNPQLKVSNSIPDWVDPDYSFDPRNPRKPNMRELMEASSGKSVEDLYLKPEENWKKISRQSSEILYGVVGANEDTRDWTSIMASDNIIEMARKQTGLMHEPKVTILSHFDKNNVLEKQTAIIEDKEGNRLRELSNSTIKAEETLLNFGATKSSIPADIETSVDPSKFDKDLLAFLKSFDRSADPIEKIAIQSASEAISTRLINQISLDEALKL